MGTWIDIFSNGKVYEMEGDIAVGEIDTAKNVKDLIQFLEDSHAGMYAIAPPIKTFPTVVKPTVSRDVPQRGVDLIKEFEGYAAQQADDRAAAYPDPIYGWKVATIGYGTTIYPTGQKVRQGDIITRDEAEKYLRWEIEQVCRPMLEKIPTWEKMNPNQRGAIYSFAYNLGSAFYRGANFTSMTTVCDSPARWNDKPWIQEQFVKFRNPGTPAEPGLKRRRIREAALFCS
jgi:GH24 family phage-related lysozyme (muramidase)